MKWLSTSAMGGVDGQRQRKLTSYNVNRDGDRETSRNSESDPADDPFHRWHGHETLVFLSRLVC